ncbi:MAG: hypothetical protein AAF198_12470 [Pseudomonadota bacterium]
MNDAELINAAAPRPYGLARSCIELGCITSRFEVINTSYRDLEDFNQHNPDCCMVLPEEVTQNRAIDLDCLIGQARKS